MSSPPPTRRHLAIRLSLAVAGLMLAGKWAAFLLTGSQAILSDAAESVVHIAATGVAAIGVRLADRPADHDHPYGHGKFAAFGAGFEGALVLAAGLAVVGLAVQDLLRGPAPHALGLGLAITASLALVNLALGSYLVRVGRRERSLALEANGQHVLSDVWTSAGVVAGVALVWLTGIAWLDPLVAIAAGSGILWSGGSLVARSFGTLVETVDPADTPRLRAVLDAAVAQGKLARYHQLRHRRVGAELFVEVHLLFAGNPGLVEAHAAACELEAAIEQALAGDRVLVTTHLEPAGSHQAAHPDDHAAFPDPGV